MVEDCDKSKIAIRDRTYSTYVLRIDIRVGVASVVFPTTVEPTLAGGPTTDATRMPLETWKAPASSITSTLKSSSGYPCSSPTRQRSRRVSFANESKDRVLSRNVNDGGSVHWRRPNERLDVCLVLVTFLKRQDVLRDVSSIFYVT